MKCIKCLKEMILYHDHNKLKTYDEYSCSICSFSIIMFSDQIEYFYFNHDNFFISSEKWDSLETTNLWKDNELVFSDTKCYFPKEISLESTICLINKLKNLALFV